MLVVEARNDGGTVPPPGSKLNLVFDPERAILLTDETPPAAGARA
jgi:hypothetical protein